MMRGGDPDAIKVQTVYVYMTYPNNNSQYTVTLILTSTDEEIDTVILNSSNNWSYTWNDLELNYYDVSLDNKNYRINRTYDADNLTLSVEFRSNSGR